MGRTTSSVIGEDDIKEEQELPPSGENEDTSDDMCASFAALSAAAGSAKTWAR